jgi:methylase of polypeptide subunit release factors
MNRDDALSSLLQALSERGYGFVTPTPLTHARVVARAGRQTACTLSDVFGWSLPFERHIVGDAMLSLMRDAGVLLPEPGAYRSAVRVSSLDGQLFLHSAYPTVAGDAVFFGPDTYRFANFVNANLPAAASMLRCADIGCGSGAGAISAASRLPASEWLLTDINAAALQLAEVNARHAGIAVQAVLSDVLAAVDGGFDLIICNPPYLADDQQRAYRHGGGDLGRELGLRIADVAVRRLNPGGRLLLYTGVAIVNGVDPFLAELRTLLDDRDCHWQYAELDPDVFGEELERPVYAQADRIAAVGLRVDRWTSSTADTAG